MPWLAKTDRWQNADADRPERHKSDLDTAFRELFTHQRTHADTNRKRAEQHGHHIGVSRQDVLREVEERREKRRTDEPQPRDPEQAQEYGAVLAREREVAPRLTERVPVDLEIGLQRRRFRHEARSNAANQRNRHATRREQHGAVLGQPGRRPADDRPDQDGHERPHFDQAIAANQFRRLEMLRQIRVFHRSEHGRMDTHKERADVKQRRAVQHETRAADQHHHYFERLHEARERGLIVFIGDLA